MNPSGLMAAINGQGLNERVGQCQVFKVEELKRNGQYRVSATSLGRKEKYTIQFLTMDKDEYPMGSWVTVRLT